MLLTREYIDKAFWQKLIAIGLPVSLQSMLLRYSASWIFSW